jgi:peptidoglycan/xylan/chitin deacetylase (PgdA/CDA1 family)
MRTYQRGRLLRARLVPARAWRGVRILGYHSIGDLPDTLVVPPQAFRRQMEAVVASGAEPISIGRALELLRAGPVRDRYVCVTFDDGYRDNLELAVPVLRELGIPATIYVVTKVIDGEATFHWFDDPPPPLSWDDCDALVAEGLVDVQPHTRTHPRLPRVGDSCARDEILGSKADLERRGYAVTSFCYPAGLYRDRELALVREAGYAAAVTTEQGVNTGSEDPYLLKRTLVFREDSADEFALKLTGALDGPPTLRPLVYRALTSRRRRAIADS